MIHLDLEIHLELHLDLEIDPWGCKGFYFVGGNSLWVELVCRGN